MNPRRPWLAALLSLLGGPLGQVYVGRFRRCIVLWMICVALLPLIGLGLLSFVPGRIALGLVIALAIATPLFLAADAYFIAKAEPDKPRKKYQTWWVYLFMFAVFLSGSEAMAIVARTYLMEAFVVPTRSMSPTILAGDRILGDKWSRSSDMKRGDIVVFYSAGPGSQLFVMRVAGLPGETLAIRDEKVLVNGVEWNEPHATFTGDMPSHVVVANMPPVTIPANCFFVLGDNRRNSYDSRFLGPIPLTDFYAMARMIHWSRARTFPDPRDVTIYENGQIRWERLGAQLQ